MIFPLQIPPLRERRDDIALLATHFAAELSAANGWPAPNFSSDALKLLESYSWPGNVRELRNAVERVLLFAQGSEITPAILEEAFPQLGASSSGRAPATGSLADRVLGYEREAVLAELRRQHFHITRTAQALGLERSHLYKKCQQLGIDLAAVRKEDEPA